MSLNLHPRAIDLSTRRCGMLQPIRPVSRNKQGNLMWECKCDCGNTTVIVGHLLAGEKQKCCGCLSKIAIAERNYKHGHSMRSGNSRTYRTWHSMKNRCFNEKVNNYQNYGARGITVCERWMDFSNFLDDMGERPKAKSLDRIDPNGNYEPSNCRWATTKEQARNVRRTTFLTHDGITLSVPDWADRLGMKRVTIVARLKRGWSHKKTLTEPLIVGTRPGRLKRRPEDLN